MEANKIFDVIIIGGSYAGLAAAMALGRALRQVLVIDNSEPCNRQTPQSHNFVTHGTPPRQIALLAKQQVEKYSTVTFFNGLATTGTKTENSFEIEVATGEAFSASKLVFATGIKDVLPAINGLAACWGISVLHCPYCHGYEVRQEKTGILANGEFAFEFSRLISNWTDDLTLFTNGPSTLTDEQTAKLATHQIKIVEKEIESVEHTHGYIQNLLFKDGKSMPIKALYAPVPFEQHSAIPATLGCEATTDGYFKIDAFNKTTVDGIFACGDNASRIRTVANAVAMGTATGIMVNKEIVTERF